jgi:hypothetical protein
MGATHPDVPELIVHSVDDDAIILWLADRSPAAAAFVEDRLHAKAGEGTDIAGKPTVFTASGTDRIYAGAEAATFFGAVPGDPRVPNAPTRPPSRARSTPAEHRRSPNMAASPPPTATFR